MQLSDDSKAPDLSNQLGRFLNLFDTLPFLLLIRSDERGVIETGSFPVAILLSCQHMKTIALMVIIDKT